ncbi:alpha/beta hydrolase [Paraburkholderia sp. SEWSISQ10-3 4]|uniref:alpha/beta fold hydrolase n=1 Tax=Paraburkholderia TaxID=1822464 RepID=UPI00224DC5EC|nr:MULTISPECIES: alpha/beta hydrolase [Paraburkholderia]MCX4140271.1 alpha/beta hydrolase [Paraburkholderia aspalathi]MDN7172958.1 alpha/beta hydrolase [Paraburkholderia sp. SEWSISQ10-3 4]MDQ6502597.1 alpha/beta hydrolase [Paraburkholderia aspalathi]
MHSPTTYRYGGHVHANGIRQHYLRFGGAECAGTVHDPVIVVPGITSPAATWAFVGECLGSRFDTYVLDVRGRGLSSAGDGLDYSLDAQAADLIAFADKLGLKRYSVLGHSMGARIGVRAARHFPAGFARLVMADPPVSGPGRRAYPSKLPWYVDSIRQSRIGMDADAMRVFCPTWTEEQLALRAQWLPTCDERAVRDSFDGFHSDDVHVDIGEIAIPLLLMTAERGDVVLEDDVREIRALAPQLLHVRVAAAGHMIPWDNEPGFYRALGDFLGESVGVSPAGHESVD